MPSVTVTNTLLANRAAALRSLVNADSFGCLYVNAATITPETVLGDLMLATFPGYAAINLVGLWGAAFKLDQGVWITVCPTQTFNCTGASAQLVHGAGIYSSLGLLGILPASAPIALHAGLAIPVQFSLLDVAAVLF